MTIDGNVLNSEVVESLGRASEVPRDLTKKDEFQKCLDRGRSEPVNLVVVLERRGVAFRRFFRALFQKMFDGETMTMAWVKLAPPGPMRPPDLPLSFYIVEAGQVTFRK